MVLVSATVSGSVLLADAAWNNSAAVARIFVEEVTRADAPSIPVAQLEIAGVDPQTTHHMFPFTLRLDGIDPTKRYELRVHIDVDGDGRIGAGDHVSTQSYPVVTQGAPIHVQVSVQRV